MQSGIDASLRIAATGSVDIGCLCRQRKGEDIPLTPEDKAIFHRASEQQERE
jgi:hypothetical protein